MTKFWQRPRQAIVCSYNFARMRERLCNLIITWLQPAAQRREARAGFFQRLRRDETVKAVSLSFLSFHRTEGRCQ